MSYHAPRRHYQSHYYDHYGYYPTYYYAQPRFHQHHSYTAYKRTKLSYTQKVIYRQVWVSK